MTDNKDPIYVQVDTTAFKKKYPFRSLIIGGQKARDDLDAAIKEEGKK